MKQASQLLNKLSNEIIKAMQRDIDSSSGKLSQSIKGHNTFSLFGAEMTIEMLEYGQYVDTGTRGTDGSLGKKGGATINRKMPPIDELNSWANSKGLNVWAVAKYIQMYGTEAHPFIYNFDEIITKNIQQITDAIGFDISNQIYTSLTHGTNIN